MKIEIPSILAEGIPIVEKVVSEAHEQGYTDTACFAIRLALDEALANAIRHGNGGDPTKSVAVEYTIDNDAFTITICDQGPGFHPDDVPDPTLDENLERPCGRGVMLMRAYMSDISYNASGNCVTMIKRKEADPPDDSDD